MDEVSYLEAFLVDSILLGRHVTIIYILMNHMDACCQSNSRILLYGRIMTKLFRAFGIDLTLESDVEEPSPYNTYSDPCMGQIKFEKAADGSWVRWVDLRVEDGHQHHDDEDLKRDMTDVQLNITPIAYKYPRQTHQLLVMRQVWPPNLSSYT